MHILHIEESFIPNLGYQSAVLTKFMALKGHKITILTTTLDIMVTNQKIFVPNDIHEQEKDLYDKYGIEIIRVKVRRIISNRCQWDSSVFDKIVEINPDVIYLHNNDSLIAIQYFLFHLNKIKIPIVSDSHMLEIASRNKFARAFRWFYRNFVTPVIIKNKIPVFRVVDDPFIQVAYKIPLELSPLMSFGSDVDIFHPDKLIRRQVREELMIDDSDFVITYAGKLSEDKDALFLANAIKSKFAKTNRRIVFIIIGNTHGKYGEQVEDLFRNSENRIIRLPLQKYKDLPMYFQCSDIGLIPSAASLSFYDMQACGLPILWSDIDVNVARTKKSNGIVFRNKDIDDLREKICVFANMSEADLFNYSNNAINYIIDNYSYDEVTDKYLEIIKKEYENKMKLTQYYKGKRDLS